MKIIRSGADGNPRELELTPEEMIVKDVHDRLMDLGHDQGTALMMLMGSKVSDGLRSPAEALDRVLADEQFLAYLAT